MSGKADSDVFDVEHESLVGDSPSHLQQGEDKKVVIVTTACRGTCMTLKSAPKQPGRMAQPLRSRIGNMHHPNTWEFLLVIQNEQSNTAVQIQQVAAGMSAGRHNVKYVRVAMAIKTLRRRYASGQLNTLQYIRGISHTMKHF
jgi:hypothetical protein